MAEELLSVRIRMEGEAELKRQFDAIAKSGSMSAETIEKEYKKAAAEIEKAAKIAEKVEKEFAKAAAAAAKLDKQMGFGPAFAQASKSIDEVGASFNRVVRNVTIFTAAVTAAAAGITAFVLGGIRAADNIEEQASALGLTTEAYQRLTAAAAEAGVKQGVFASAFQRFTQQVLKGAAEADASLLKLAQSLTSPSTLGGARIIEVGQNAQQAFQAIAKGADIASDKLKAQGINKPIAAITAELAKLANGTQEQRGEFERMTGVLLPARNATEAFADSLRRAKDPLAGFNIELAKSADGTIDMELAFQSFAESIKQIENPAKRMAAAVKLFGQRAGPQLLPFLEQGREGIQAFNKELEKLGLDKESIKASAAASRALDLLSFAAGNARNAVTAAFAPLAANVARGLTTFIATNRQALVEFARTIAKDVQPYIDAFFKLLNGQGDDFDPILQEMAALKDRVLEIGTAFADAIKKFIIPAFKALVGVADTVAKVVNDIFGTKFTGAILLASAAILQFLGVFRLIAAVSGAVGGVLGLLVNTMRQIVRFIGWPAVLAASLLVLLGRFESVRDAARQVANTLNSVFGTNAFSVDTILNAIGIVVVALGTLATRVGIVRAALLTLIPSPLLVALGTLAALIGDVTRQVDPAQKKLQEINKEFAKTGDIEAYKRAMAEFDKVGAGAADKAKDSVKSLTDEWKKSANQTVTEWRQTAPGVYQAVRRAVDDSKAAINEIPDEVKRKATATEALKVTIPPPDTSQWTQAFDQWLLQNENGYKDLERLLTGTPIKPLQPAFDSVSLDGLSRLVERAQSIWSNLFGPVAADAQKAFESAKNQAVEQIRSIQDFLNTPISFDAFFSGISSGFDSLIEGIKQKWEALKSFFSRTPPAPQAPAQDPADAVRQREQRNRERRLGTQQIAQEATQAVPQVNALKTATDGLDQSLTTNTQDAAALGTAIDALNTPLTTVATAADTAAGALDQLSSARPVPFLAETEQASAALQGIAATSQQVATQVVQPWTGVAEALIASIAPFGPGFASAGAEAAQGLTSVIAVLDQIIARAAEAVRLIQQAKESGGGGSGFASPTQRFARGGLVRGPGTGTSDSILARLSRGEGVLTARAIRYYGSGIVDFINRLRMPKFAQGGIVGGIPGFARGGVAGGGGEIQFDLQKMSSGIQQTINSTLPALVNSLKQFQEDLVKGVAKMIEETVKTVQDAAFIAGGGGGRTLAFAHGGVLRGRGTGTSDSILARVSNGEGIVTSRAVRYYGEDFIHALNALRAPRFAFGGIVDGITSNLSAPQFPAGTPDQGGATGPGRGLTLVLDGKEFSGLTGPSKTMDDLERHAMRRQIGSTGTKPDWYR